MTIFAPKIYPEDTRRTSAAMVAALLEVLDGCLPLEQVVDVDYILHKPRDVKYVKVELHAVSNESVYTSFVLESGAKATYRYNKNSFNRWVLVTEPEGNVPANWLLTSFDEVRALNHAVLVVRGLVRDSEDV